MAQHQGEQFLHQKNQQLHSSGPVEFAAHQARIDGEQIPNEPVFKIEAYLAKLAGHSLIAEVPEDQPVVAGHLLERQRRQIEKRVIAVDQIPASYWETRRRAAREQGHGDIEIDTEFKEQAAEVLQADQRESLRDWVDYLTSKDAQYPVWFKYYTINGVTRLSDYDKDKGQFPRRSSSTTDPFPALNREALSYVYDKINEQVAGILPEDQEAAKIISGGNFAKLYALSLQEIGFADPELLKETKGEWVKYTQSENPKDVSRLSNSLKGYGTGWCTAGEGYARTQLADGDFYVFYSLDKDNVARVPRIAIRMEDDFVAEVRGIVGGGADVGPVGNARQEIEPALIDTAMEKVKDLPGGEYYLAIADNMKQLTDIDNRVKAGAELTDEDLYALYVSDMMGFGYGEDPRVEELLEGRDSTADLERIVAVFDNRSIAYTLGEQGRYLELGAIAPLLEQEGIDWRDITEKLISSMDFYSHRPVFNIMDALGPYAQFDQQQFLEKCVEQSDDLREVVANLHKLDSNQVDIRWLTARLLEGYDNPKALIRSLNDGNRKIVDEQMIVDYWWDVGDPAAELQNRTQQYYRPMNLIENLEKFSKNVIDQKRLATWAFENETFEILANNLEKFEPGVIDNEQLARGLITSRRSFNGVYTLWKNKDKFGPLPQDITDLIDAEGRRIAEIEARD